MRRILNSQLEWSTRKSTDQAKAAPSKARSAKPLPHWRSPGAGGVEFLMPVEPGAWKAALLAPVDSDRRGVQANFLFSDSGSKFHIFVNAWYFSAFFIFSART